MNEIKPILTPDGKVDHVMTAIKSMLVESGMPQEEAEARALRKIPAVGFPAADARSSGKIVKTAIVLFILSGLFPPWIRTSDRIGDGGWHTQTSVGIEFILTPPAQARDSYGDYKYDGCRVDLRLLAVEWITIAAFGASPLLVRKIKKNTS